MTTRRRIGLVAVGVLAVALAAVVLAFLTRQPTQCLVVVSGTTINVSFEGERAAADCQMFAQMSDPNFATYNGGQVVTASPYGSVVCVQQWADHWHLKQLPPGSQAYYEAVPDSNVTVTIRDAGWPTGGSDPTEFCSNGGGAHFAFENLVAPK